MSIRTTCGHKVAMQYGVPERTATGSSHLAHYISVSFYQMLTYPSGTLSEKEVRLLHPGKYDRHGFRRAAPDAAAHARHESAASPAMQPMPAPGSPSGADNNKGPEAGTSGTGRAASAPASDGADARRQAQRVAKWTKMLGPEGAGLESYLGGGGGLLGIQQRRHAAKIKRRARKVDVYR